MHFMIFTTSYVLQLGVLKFNFFRNAEKIWGNLHTSKKNWEFLLIICGLFRNSWTLRRLFFLVFNADFTQCARPSKAIGAISVSMVGTSELCPKIIWTIDQCLTQIWFNISKQVTCWLQIVTKKSIWNKSLKNFDLIFTNLDGK